MQPSGNPQEQKGHNRPCQKTSKEACQVLAEIKPRFPYTQVTKWEEYEKGMVSTHDIKHNTSCVKHGGGSAMAWACKTAHETGVYLCWHALFKSIVVEATLQILCHCPNMLYMNLNVNNLLVLYTLHNCIPSTKYSIVVFLLNIFYHVTDNSNFDITLHS